MLTLSKNEVSDIFDLCIILLWTYSHNFFYLLFILNIIFSLICICACIIKIKEQWNWISQMCNTISVSASITWYVLDVHVSCIKVTMSPANLQEVFSLSLSTKHLIKIHIYWVFLLLNQYACISYMYNKWLVINKLEQKYFTWTLI